MKLRFKTVDVLASLNENRKEHIEIVREAQKGHRDKWLVLLCRALDEAKLGGPVETFLQLDVPMSHVDDFDRVIEMLEMTTEAEIVLDQSMFQSYIRNKWSWDRQFLLSNSAYSTSAAVKLGDE